MKGTLRLASAARSLALALAACSREPPPLPHARGDASAGPSPPSSTAAPLAARPAASAAALARRAELSDGAHDYRGLLGQRTPIAAHLVRAGASLSGFYIYVGVGASIPLTGSVEEAAGGDGPTLVLTESRAGKISGTMRLHVASDGLTGEWVGPNGGKGFPVRLSPGAPWAATGADAGEDLAALAEKCLADVGCPATEADRLFVAADDARAPTLDCYRFLDGAGTRKDAARGRRCLERGGSKLACDLGSSPGLDQAELAFLRIDGLGGPADLAGARALFRGCLDDSTTASVLGYADAREHDPAAPKVDFCRDVGGTTLTSNACGARARRVEATRVALAAKAVAAGLDYAGRRAFLEASKAYEAYVQAMGEYTYELFAQGTMRDAMLLGREQELYEQRAKELGALAGFVADDVSAAEVAREEQALVAAVAAVTTSTPAEKTALEKTQTTWAAYHDAEVRFYVRALGGKQGADRVRRAVRSRLALRRTKECAFPEND